MAGFCELCGATENIAVHQIRKLADLDLFGQEQPNWAALMAKRRQKTLIVCPTCHDGIHVDCESAPHGDHWRARCG
ncbi:hypothetical protein AB0F71_27705 [Kitasatospora sp. NPDC028055]|uniref:HNH endonuclease n=1 Tax=Kitasatospora sp. NPDC028055 TaxID=3155653 RepID=UPI00340DA418